MEMPTADFDRSAEFYQKIFEWDVRKRSDGSVGFDDGVNQVRGTWMLGRQPASASGMVVSIMVDNTAATIDLVVAAGCEIVEPVGAPCTRAHRTVSRSRRKRDEPVPASELK
jgi:predicted enzyme related to lactoylglutathione lyase